MPSAGVVDALARVLTLSPAERAYLHRLTGRAAPEPDGADRPAPGLLFILERLGDTPAQILSDLGAVLAQNKAADTVFPWVVDDDPRDANVYERWFCHDEVRAAFPEDLRPAYSDAQAGELRATLARYDVTGDTRGHDLVIGLLERSPEFRRAWSTHQVHDGRAKRIWIPSAGGSSLAAHVTVDEHTRQRLMAFEPVGGDGT